MKSAILTLSLLASVSFAKEAPKTEEVKSAEKAMMDACSTDFPKEVKGKSFKQVARWVEGVEHGKNKEATKKMMATNCFSKHEDWEKVAEQKDEGE